MDLEESIRANDEVATPRSLRARWSARACGAVLILLVLVPAIDLGISGIFYSHGLGFVWRNQPVPEAIHEAIQVLARLIGVATLLGLVHTSGLTLWDRWKSRPSPDPVDIRAATLLTLGPRSWAFLFLGLVLGPGLIANVVLKDMWSRARPVHVEEFGGHQYFSPPMVISNQCEKNCSFVAGDAAMGFYLQIFAYVVARRLAGPMLIVGMAAGLSAGLLRIGMGAHFFSDVIYAGVFMTVTIAGLHAAMFAPKQTLDLWRRWTPWCDRQWPSRGGRP